ncbi:MAG: hypothetical protein ACI4BI_00440 [Anaerotardibacter sp.]
MSTNTNTQQNTKMSKAKMALIVLAFVVVFGGQILVFSVMADNLIQTFREYRHEFSYSYYDDERVLEEDLAHQFNASDDENSYFRKYFDLSGFSNENITTKELDTIKSLYYSTQGMEDSIATPGVYRVGEDIEPGVYYVAGENTEEYTYFILTPSSEGETYETTAAIIFEGFTLAQLEEGQVFVCDNEEGFCLRDELNPTYSSPYGPGLYEVGRDIPAGTYRFSVRDDELIYGYFIWNDLEYTDDSLLEGGYEYGPSEDISLELKEGTYVELYNASLVASSTTNYV